MEMQFRAQKKRMGNSHGIIIPKPVADFLKEDTEYVFVIKEVDNGEDTQKIIH